MAVYAWNPLVIVEFAGSGHNDVLALLGIVVRVGAGEEVAGAGERADGAGGNGQGISRRAVAGVDPQRGLAGKARGLVGGGAGGRGVRCVCSRRIGMRYGMFRANLTYYEATWKNYHASLYTVIDWMTGGRTRIPAIASVGSNAGAWRCGWRGNAPSPRARRIC